MNGRNDRIAHTAPSPRLTPESRNTQPRMRAVQVRPGPVRLELVVNAAELTQADAAVFQRKLQGALREAPHVLLVHLVAANSLDAAGVDRLRAAADEAELRNVRLLLRVCNRSARMRLQQAGLQRQLGIAA